jgi:hypothetical protein
MYDTVIFFFQFELKLLQKKKKKLFCLPFRSVEFVLHNFVLN